MLTFRHLRLSTVTTRRCLLCSDVAISGRYLSSSSAPKEFFPVGKSDFPSLMKKKQFFVDNSEYIRTFEEMGENLIFTRPPRFGKSLLQSMMQSYYDINTSEEEFDVLFGSLKIGKNPTPLARKFYVLPIDLSVEVVNDVQLMRQAMHNEINESLRSFIRRYKIKEARIYDDNANSSLVSVASALRDECPGSELYILIDEYDRFANKLMLENVDLYQKIIAGETKDPASSPLRGFLETVKVCMHSVVIKRITYNYVFNSLLENKVCSNDDHRN